MVSISILPSIFCEPKTLEIKSINFVSFSQSTKEKIQEPLRKICGKCYKIKQRVNEKKLGKKQPSSQKHVKHQTDHTQITDKVKQLAQVPPCAPGCCPP